MSFRSELNLLGVSYKTAPVELREKLAVPSAELPKALEFILSLGASEAVILSTCNRVEGYGLAEVELPVAERLRGRWESIAGVPLENQVYAHRGESAVGHLFRVAAGLDSMVLGEPQI